MAVPAAVVVIEGAVDAADDPVAADAIVDAADLAEEGTRTLPRIYADMKGHGASRGLFPCGEKWF